MLIEIKERGKYMVFPNENDLKLIREKLEKAEPSHVLSDDASKSDILKYKLCKKFVVYIKKNNITQAQLAEKLKIDPARINEIIKYRIHLFTVDRLMNLVEKIDPELKIEVA